MFVSGNESGDLDSCISSIVHGVYCWKVLLGWFLSNQGKQIVTSYLDLPSSSIQDRKDLEYVYEHIKSHKKAFENNIQIKFRDEIDIVKEVQSKNSNSLWLVDHNRLSERMNDLGSYVVGIIDHHKREQSVDSYAGLKFELITKTGSNCSLVTKYWKKVIEALEGEHGAFLCFLLFTGIVIDTNNFKPPKVTQLDKEMGAVLFQKFKATKNTFYPSDEKNEEKWVQSYSDKIAALRNCIDGVSGYGLLTRDLKSVVVGSTRITVPSIAGLDLSNVENINKFVKDFPKYYKEFHSNNSTAHVVVVMGCGVFNGKFKRHVLFLTKSDSANNHLVKKNDGVDFLTSRTQIKLFPGFHCNSYVLDIENSRKQIIPYMKRIFAENAKL